MRRFFSSMICLLLICTLALILRISLIQALPNTIYVNDDNIDGPWDGTPEHPYQNVTSGLYHALAGDTIFVYNGTYSEQLIIDKPISLAGENKYSTIIDGNKTGNVIKITTDNVSITNFTIRNSLPVFEFSGIRLQHSNGNNISYNIITKNYEGIWLQNSSSNTFIDNNISNSSEGIYAINSSNNILMNNKISNNEFGIVLRESSNNTIFHNSFIDNTWRSASIINSINSWDNGIEGNHWSDYKGADDDHDAIGDTPYIMDGNNQDNHPIMGTFSDFTVVYEKETSHILTISNSTIYQFQFNETIKMLSFNVTGIDNTAGFCRITIPQLLVNKPYIVLVDDEQVNATLLPLSNATHTLLHFTYNHSTREVKIFSKPYYELLQKCNALLEDYQNLNSTYYQLLANYDSLNQTYYQTLANYTQLLTDYNSLNQTYWQVLANYTRLQADFNFLNQTYEQLLVNHTELLADYTALNETYQNVLTNYSELLADYDDLNQTYLNVLANYTILLADFTALNQIYQQVVSNYTQLQANFNILNQTYEETLINYTKLQNEYHSLLEEHDSLNQTYQQVLASYTELSTKHDSLNQTYQELMVNYTKLQSDYSSIERDYNAFLNQYNSLNSTYNKIESAYANTRIALWFVSMAAAAITVITSSIAIKYGRRSKEQEKLIEKYKSELEQISPLDIARVQFETDVQRRKGKIEEFEQKYGVTVRPRNTLEDVIRSLELKKKKEEHR